MYGLNSNLNLLDFPQVRFLIKKDGPMAFACLYSLFSECQRNGKPFVMSDYGRDVSASDLNINREAFDVVLNDCVRLELLSLSDGFLWLGSASLNFFKDSDELPEKVEARRNEYPYADVVELWNSICVHLPRITAVSQQRRNKMRQRFKEWSIKNDKDEILNFAKAVFTNCANSEFLNGKNNRNWCASFDWIFANDKNYLKVYEGNYNRKPSNAKFDDLANLCDAMSVQQDR